MLRLVPPAGAPISLRQISAIFIKRFFSYRKTTAFRDIIIENFGVRYCFLLNSGRTALFILLKSLDNIKRDKKREVVIPAYTCFSVAAAAVKSGLKIRLIDIDPNTMDYDYDKLKNTDFSNVLAIVGCNLFGILSDWEKLRSIADENGIFLIDDAAQSMGSKFNSKLSGTFGDAGFFSLDRGKNLSTFSGGVLITDNEEIAAKTESIFKEFRKNGLIFELQMLTKMLSYSILLNPGLYWLPDKLPFLKLGQTVFEENFTIGLLSEIQKCAGEILYPGLGDLNAKRLVMSNRICQNLNSDSSLSVPGYSKEKSPTYLRLPVLAQSQNDRDIIIAVLRKAGIKSSEMYPSTINRIDGIGKHLTNPEDNFSGAQEVVDRLFTLPTHPYVRDNDIAKISEILSGF